MSGANGDLAELAAEREAIEAYERDVERHLPPDDRGALPEIEDAAEFCQREIPLPSVLVEGLLHRGSKMSLGAATKACKSWLQLDLCFCVAYGLAWLGLRTTRSRVLFVNFEIQAEFMQRHITTLAREYDLVQEPGWFDVWNLRGQATSYREIFPKIIKRVEGRDYGLIDLDPIYKLYGSTDENSARNVAAMLNAVESLAVSTQAAVVFGAHHSKGNQAAKNAMNRVSGSGVFARDPDTILNLTPHENADCFTVESTVRNFPPTEPFVLEWRYPLFRRQDDLDPTRLKTIGRPSDYTEEKAIDALHGRMDAKDWRAEIGCSERQFLRLKRALLDKGKVREVFGTRPKQWERAQ